MRLHELTVAVDLDAHAPERVVAVGTGEREHLTAADVRTVEHAADLLTDALARADLLGDVTGELDDTDVPAGEKAEPGTAPRRPVGVLLGIDPAALATNRGAYVVQLAGWHAPDGPDGLVVDSVCELVLTDLRRRGLLADPGTDGRRR